MPLLSRLSKKRPAMDQPQSSDTAITDCPGRPLTPGRRGPGNVHPGPDAAVDRPAALRWLDRTPFFQAGLAGYSDGAMRLIARRHGCAYCVSEAMLDTLLVAGGKGRRIAELTDDDHPIAGQIIGADPATMAEAARIIERMGHDVIDVNCACPVKKLRRRHRGGHLLADPDQAIDILKAVRDAVEPTRPVTAKLRRAFDDSASSRRNFEQVLQATIDLGYAGVTVHARTVRQKYQGPSHWPFLADLTARYRQALQRGFFICGSGDIEHAQDIFDMIERTGVSGVSVARGAIGNPWLFEQARQIMAGLAPTEPTIAQQRAVLDEHFRLCINLHGEKLAGRLMRKFGIRFARHHPDPQRVAKAFIDVQSLADWRAVLDEHYQCEPMPRPALRTGPA
jgi:nifR3 family TIM-barrel protein